MITQPHDLISPIQPNSESGITHFHALTKREYFAALAIQTFSNNAGDRVDHEIIAYHSVKIADALIITLNRQDL